MANFSARWLVKIADGKYRSYFGPFTDPSIEVAILVRPAAISAMNTGYICLPDGTIHCVISQADQVRQFWSLFEGIVSEQLKHKISQIAYELIESTKESGVTPAMISGNIMGYKGHNFLDTGYFFAPYIPHIPLVTSPTIRVT